MLQKHCNKKLTCPRAIVHIYEFQPFRKRAQIFPKSSVIALDFVYDRKIVSLIRSAISLYHPIAKNKAKMIMNAGGWLPEKKLWFVEPSIWPRVKKILIAANIEIQGEIT